ncbi:MAG: DNA-binding protein [Thaumarchaeota archaeon]|nr:DNA-binding protein [Nitrososphaerota archaeon]
MDNVNKKPTDAEEIFLEFKQAENSKKLIATPPQETHDAYVRNVIFIGAKPIMTYVTATLTQLSNQQTVTIKARGKRITQAVDVSQMIIKRMNTVGYKLGGIRISSDLLTSQDGKQRNVSAIEIDIKK